jgi:DUF4097 and DUF4098 domain-containing protein YvlB
MIPVGLLAAQNPSQVEKTLNTTPTPRVTVSNLAGRIIVRGWNKTQVHALYNTSSPLIEVDFDQLPSQGAADKVHFITRSTGRTSNATADYTLDVPQASSLEIHNPQGSVRIEAIQGSTSVDSIAGSVSLSDVTGHLSVQTVGGDIDIIGAAGRVEAYSTYGSLHFINASPSDVRANTTTGDIVYQGNFAPGGRYVMTNYSGNIEILCPPSTSFELNAKTVRGRLENAFPMVTNHRLSSALGRGNSLFGTISTGKATLEVKSFSGTIQIHPQP